MTLTARLTLVLAAAAGAACQRITSHRTMIQLRRQLAATTHRADHDRLTGLLNRGGFETAYPAGSGIARWLLIVDLDAFKAVNDQHGHPTGDLILTALGTRTRHLLHEVTGIAGRLGGDEFAVLLPQRRHLPVDAIAATLAAPVTVHGPNTGPATVTASIGITVVSPAMPITQALSQADIALYQAKQRGQPVTYQPGMAYPRRPWLRRHARDHHRSTRSPRRELQHRRTVLRRRPDTGALNGRPEQRHPA